MIRSNLGLSSQTLCRRHTYGTLTEKMDIKRTNKKGRHTYWKKCHIYKIGKNNLHINDININ
jgi:hypothetical protein